MQDLIVVFTYLVTRLRTHCSALLSCSYRTWPLDQTTEMSVLVAFGFHSSGHLTRSSGSPKWKPNLPQQRSQKLRRRSGLVNFSRRFVPLCAAVPSPLTALPKRSKKPSSAVQWIPTAEQACSREKLQLANAKLLSHPQHDTPTNIMVDASDVATRHIIDDTVWKPVAFLLRQMTIGTGLQHLLT